MDSKQFKFILLGNIHIYRNIIFTKRNYILYMLTFIECFQLYKEPNINHELIIISLLHMGLFLLIGPTDFKCMKIFRHDLKASHCCLIDIL